VKQSESNPLRRELARGQHGEPHPDPDLLTALGEGALLQRERLQVLAHVAVCTDCRAILSTAAAAAVDPDDEQMAIDLTRSSPARQRLWLPWASIAAGILVVCSAVLFYQQRGYEKENAVATREAVQTLSSIQPQPSSPALEGKKTPSKREDHPTSPPLQAPLPSQGATAAISILTDQNPSAKRSDVVEGSYQASAISGEIAVPTAPVLKAAQAPRVSAFANATAQPALPAASATAARPHWRINDMGQVERSFGDDVWQGVLPQEQSKMRVVSVFAGDVWIGGEHSRLYHSADNGTTWKLIALPSKDVRDHSIAHIHFQTAQSGTVESDDGTVWTTSDGGTTWNE